MSSKKKQRTTSAARATIEASLQIALEEAKRRIDPQQSIYANAKLQSEREAVTSWDTPEGQTMTEVERIDAISDSRTQGTWGITPTDVAFMDPATAVIQ